MTLSSLFPSRLTVAAVLGCAILLPLAVTASWNWGVAHRDAARIERDRKGLDLALNDPVTGYVARLSTCQVSLRGAEASIGRQNAAIESLRLAGEQATARAAASVQAAQDRARSAERAAQSILQERPREGEGQCDAAFRLHQENAHD